MAETSELPRGAVLSLREAAAATGVSYSTIKRRQPEFAHAYQDRGGVWRVPITDLLGAGLHLRPKPDDSVSQAHESPVNGAESPRVRELLTELAHEKTARQVAETKVQLLTANVEDLRHAMRAISGPQRAAEAPEVFTPVQAPPAPAEPQPRRAEPPPRRGLWARIRGD